MHIFGCWVVILRQRLLMDKLIKHLGFLQETSNKTCQYLSGKEINTIQFFCLGLLKRVDDTMTATKALFDLLPKNHKHEFSIGILFRALILDTLISMNLFKLIKDLEAQEKNEQETEEAVMEFCNKFLSDGLKVTLSYIQYAETLGMRTPAETQQAFKNMGHDYKRFFDNYLDDGTPPTLKFPKQDTAKQLFGKLAKSDELKEVAKIYDIYAYLSKYDHFGIIYYNAINEKLESKIKIYASAAETFVAHTTLIHVILARHSLNDEFINEQSKVTNGYLLNNVILTTLDL